MTRNDLAGPVRRGLIDYRVPISATIMVAALASMFVLGSQSASSFATYLLALYVLAAAPRWRSLFLDWGFLALVGLLLYLPLTSLWSTPLDPRGALSQVTRAVLVFAFVVSIAECMQVDWFRQRMTWVVGVVGAVAAAAAMWVFFATPPEDGRLNGLGQLDSHVAAGMVFAVAGICALSWLLDTRSWRPAGAKAAVIVAVAVLVAAVALTGSRNAMACGLLGVGMVLIARRAPSATHCVAWIVGLAVAMVGVLVAAYVFVPGADSLILPRGDSLRLGIWTYYAERIAQSPWFGLGILTDDLTEIDGMQVLHPHNLFLAVAWQGGLLAIALMVVVIATTLKTLLRHFAAAQAKLGLAIWCLALPGYLIDGHELIDKIGWTWLLFWLPVAISLSLRAGRGLGDARRFGPLAAPTA